MNDHTDHILNGHYGGIVTDIEDPLKMGRVKCKVGVLGPEFETTWAIPLRPSAGPQRGIFNRLSVDDGCFVVFVNGDVEVPVVLGSYFAAPGGVNEVPEELQRDEPDADGYFSPGGHSWVFDDNPDSLGVRLSSIGGNLFIFDDRVGKEAIFLIHKTGSQFQVTPEGNMILQHVDGSQISLSEGSVLAVSKDGASISLGEQAVITSSDGSSIVSLAKDAVSVISGKDVIVQSPTVSLLASAINLGDGAKKSLTIAEALADLFDKHIHATALGPSGPPLPPNTAALSNLVPATSFASLSIKVKGNL